MVGKKLVFNEFFSWAVMFDCLRCKISARIAELMACCEKVGGAILVRFKCYQGNATDRGVPQTDGLGKEKQQVVVVRVRISPICYPDQGHIYYRSWACRDC